MANIRKTPRYQKSSAKAKAEVNKMKAVAAKATPPPSKESEKKKNKKNTAVGKDSEAERQKYDWIVGPSTKKAVVAAPSCSAKSKANKKSDNNFDRKGIESIIKAAAAVAVLMVPVKRKATAVNKAAAATAPINKTKVKKPGPQTEHFSELCQYKADHGTMRVPWTSADSNNILAKWVNYTRKGYENNLLLVVYVDALNVVQFEWTAGQITNKVFAAWFAELLEFQNIHGTLQFVGDDRNNFPKLTYWCYYAKKTDINVLTNKSKNAVFALPLCKMIVDIGIVTSRFYLY
jgi:hypothetical protein